MITKLKAALDALNRCTKYEQADYDAITDLRTVIAQLEQAEPFGIWHQADDPDECEFFLFKESGDVSCPNCIKVYTHPAAPVQPVREPLTEDLHTFLDAAAGEGFVLDGVDAADLYIALFPERYAANGITKD